MVEIEVRSRIPGSDAIPDVLVELASEQTTVRELIRRAVEGQIGTLRVDQQRCRRMLDRQYLSPGEIREQAAAGAVRMPVRDAPPEVDAEVARAVKAFERGAFTIFVGGRQVERLDEQVVLRLGEPVVFLRLVALVGG
ncbi:MAG: hypothetical protein ACRDTM_17300 [Micromonosporaceae bacterium]